jgi:putative acetyltransferase
MTFEVRSLELEDANAIAALISEPAVARRLGNTPFDGAAGWRARLESRDLQRSLALGAFEGERLIGFLTLDAQPAVRQQHVARIAMAVDAKEHRRGVGSALLGAAVDAADRWLQIVRIELGVQADNAAAIALYQKHGFVIEARRRADMLLDGMPADGLWMARIRPGFVAPAAIGDPPAFPERRPRGAITVRARVEGDSRALARMHETDSVMEGTFQLPFQARLAWERRFAASTPSMHVLVAELDGALVGAAGLFPLGTNPRMRHVRALGMSVDPSAQGRGAGHALMQALMTLADDYLGLQRIELEVYVDNDRARALYERYGFEREGTLRANAFRRGTYVDAYTMSRVRSTAAGQP